jgi:NAD(P)-dependent dehydrogenase (short-subunit alcohol dehydrogenase family)
MKTVIVFGGSGLIGKEVCKYLSDTQEMFGETPVYSYHVFNADINSTHMYSDTIYTDILNSYSVDQTFKSISTRYDGIFAIVNCTYPKPQRYMTETWYNETDNDYLTFFNQHLYQI